MSKYQELIDSGVDKYVEALDELGLFDDIYKRHRTDKEGKINYFKTCHSYSPQQSYLCLTDIRYSMDYYEGFEGALNDAIKITFGLSPIEIIDITVEKSGFEYTIVTQFIESRKKVILGESYSYSNSLKKGIDVSEKVYNDQEHESIDQIWKIIITLENKSFEFVWHLFFLKNPIIEFLNFLNRVALYANLKSRWFAMASYETENFVFTSTEKFNLMMSKGLIPEEGFKPYPEEYGITYPKGIQSFYE